MRATILGLNVEKVTGSLFGPTHRIAQPDRRLPELRIPRSASVRSLACAKTASISSSRSVGLAFSMTLKSAASDELATWSGSRTSSARISRRRVFPDPFSGD
jgi:hypothetical protein